MLQPGFAICTASVEEMFLKDLPEGVTVCPDCGRAKMLFETKEKAQRFIEWNGRDLPFGGDRLRPYYCPACCGWHISHMEYSESYEGRTERLINEYNKKKQWQKKKYD